MFRLDSGPGIFYGGGRCQLWRSGLSSPSDVESRSGKLVGIGLKVGVGAVLGRLLERLCGRLTVPIPTKLNTLIPNLYQARHTALVDYVTEVAMLRR